MTAPKTETEKNLFNDDLKNFLKIEPISETSKRDENVINYMIQMLKASQMNAIQDSDKSLPPIAKEKIEFKSLFPKRKMLDEQNFENFDQETLFYIFYFQQGTYEQFLAAKELKKRSWRFHKKHYLWFKRVDPPKVTTKEYEQGNYYLFDFEKNWSQRKKTDFLFKYCYLEAE